MSGDRRYRQSGVPQHLGAPAGAARATPASAGHLRDLESQPTSRCAGCGGVLPITADSLTQCPHCRAELHTCRQCSHFDTARRFECAQPVAERIADKRARNDCALFSLMVTVERDTSAGSVRPDDARRAFGNLFRK